MKRVFCYLALLVCMETLVSCSAANSLVQTSTRLVQSVTRSVGLGR